MKNATSGESIMTEQYQQCTHVDKIVDYEFKIAWYVAEIQNILFQLQQSNHWT